MFGEISGQEMELNDAGRMVEKIWCELQVFYPNVTVDAFVLMPNHIHGIIIINSHINVGAGPCACPRGSDVNIRQPQGVAPTNAKLTLPDVVHRFKSMTTKLYINGVKQNNWAPFPEKLWQRNYYEHVTRNDIDLKETKEYIMNNPKKWHLDKYNPKKMAVKDQ